MKIITIFLLLSTLLSAEYLRTIRISSFNTQIESQVALEELRAFMYSYPEIISLQNKTDFEFKARKSGKYFITIVEPFTQREVLQKVLDTLRIEYKDVYVTSLKRKDLPEKEKKVIKEVIQTEVITPLEKIVPEVSTLTIDKDELIIPEETSEVVAVLPEIEKVEEIPVKLSQEVPNEESSLGKYLWQSLSFILFLILLYTIRNLLKYKKENEIYFNSDLMHTEKYNQLSLEIRDREKYLSHASHELRAPMTAILGLTHIVLDSDLEQQDKEYLLQIENSTKNLLSIVNDILDVSKIKAGELHIEKTEFNINNTLEYVSSIISIQAKDNNINCIVDIDEDVPSHLIGDSLRLGQILINLLGNAVKFSKNGKVTLNVQKVSNSGDNVTIKFIVSDNGIGMSEEQLNKVFQSFSQANDSTTRKFGGTGLGLSISQELVKMMHGEIKVKSKLNEGTTFSFSLVFKLKDHLNKRQYRLPSSKFLNKQILLIDSSAKNVMPLIRMLGYFNYKTHTIPSFEESILDESIQFDIVIINKNQLNSLTIEKLQEMQRKQNFKIVVLNELFSEINPNILHKLEIDTYLQTPFNQQNILNMMINLYASKKLTPKSQVKHAKHILQDIEKKKILIAEDNEVNHKVISGLLANTKIDITYAINGKEALEKVLSNAPFDLVLMDISMPLMDGYETTKEIRKHKEYDNLPILALTADVMNESIQQALDSGMQGHISKPIIIDIFYKKIYDALHLEKQILNQEPSVHVNSALLDGEYEEISIEIGLERYNNDKEFFNSILKDFKKMYINSPLDLEELCAKENYKDARHKAMDIKDVSLGIGAYKLCESAAAIEYDLEKGARSNYKELIAFYEIELGKLFKDIDTYLKKNHS